MKIAVIPARGGSKRIPRKNVKLFCGKPMLAWSIEAAQAAGVFDHIIVSTEDAEIASVAREWGAEVPFTRPAELADDHAGTTAVIAHATRWALSQEWPLQAVCCIYATAPLVRLEDIQRGLSTLAAGSWAYAFSATEYAASIFRSFRERSDGGIDMLFPEHFTSRSQDLAVALHDAAQFYWGRPSAWLQGERIFDRHSAPVIIPRWRVQDIDTQEDWMRAELIAPSILRLRI
jgi:pseudaminic acid cytidylyltransferase